MKKAKLTHIKSAAVPLPNENVDTDQIIPARFLKVTTREGFGENLFRDWRFNADGSKKDFILNNPTYKGEILIAGKNFGSGSSREHAAWALVDYGFKAVISSFFGDIFKNNALNNSLLPIVIPQDSLDKLLDEIQKNPSLIIEIDLDKQEITVPSLQIIHTFEINPYKKVCIMNGYDDIEYILSMKDKVEKFESTRQNDYSV